MLPLAPARLLRQLLRRAPVQTALTHLVSNHYMSLVAVAVGAPWCIELGGQGVLRLISFRLQGSVIINDYLR